MIWCVHSHFDPVVQEVWFEKAALGYWPVPSGSGRSEVGIDLLA